MVSEKYAHLVDTAIQINPKKDRILKNELMVLDLLAQDNWDRPIYYAVTVGSENFAGLENYFQLEGFAYQITPIKSENKDGQYGRVDTEKMYDNVMHKFIFDGWNDDNVYLDENHQRMGINIRNNLSRLATALNQEGEKEKAIEILDKTMEVLPPSRIPHNYFSLFIAEGYYDAGAMEKGDEVMRGLAELNFQELDFFTTLRPSLKAGSMSEIQRNMAIYTEIQRSLQSFSRKNLINEINNTYEGAFQRLGLFEKK
jgi:tetratricopeptide (TPR) repeat protein